MKVTGRALAAVAAAVAVVASLTALPTISAQGTIALSGGVSSQSEGRMEGVVVTARREGANFDVSVVSDAEGTYRFPTTHLAPGTYALTIRAIGYELPAPLTATVAAGKTATADLALKTTAEPPCATGIMGTCILISALACAYNLLRAA